MSIEEAQRQGLEIDDQLQADFNQCKLEHQQQSRAGAKERFSGGLADTSDQTTRYHTVTHLLHAALRQVLGEQVEQQGSNITQERLRFDFNHPQALQNTELKQVEKFVNDWIKQELPVNKETMDKEQALDSGALATFKGRYPDQVTVYTIAAADSGPEPEQDWVSRELCGGPHVSSTAQLKPIEIYKEKSASAGVRRIYAREKN
jgi:alanyl-tRNA synthetase